MTRDRQDLLDAFDRLTAERNRLVDELDEIREALQDPNRKDPATGKRMSGEDYWVWRHRAKKLLRFKEREARAVNAALKQLRSERAGALEEAQAERRHERRERLDWIEWKLDLILEHLEIKTHRAPPPPLIEEAKQATATDAHGTPWEDAMHKRLPGSFESGKRR